MKKLGRIKMKKKSNVSRCGLLVLMTLLAGPNIASANSQDDTSQAVQSSFLNNLVERSDLIFRGTLTEVSQGLSIEEIPYTFVTYKVAQVIAGQYAQETITLKFIGGVFANGNRLAATNTPNVALGEEAILMVQQRQNTGCDFVECEHGRFVLTAGKVIAANESAIVIDDKGGLDYISLAARENGEHKSSLAKANITRFISHLKNLDKSFSTKRKTAAISVVNIDKYTPFEAYPALTQPKRAPQVPKSALQATPDAAKGNAHDRWETEQLRKNGGNPVLNISYSSEQK